MGEIKFFKKISKNESYFIARAAQKFWGVQGVLPWTDRQPEDDITVCQVESLLAAARQLKTGELQQMGVKHVQSSVLQIFDLLSLKHP